VRVLNAIRQAEHVVSQHAAIYKGYEDGRRREAASCARRPSCGACYAAKLREVVPVLASEASLRETPSRTRARQPKRGALLIVSPPIAASRRLHANLIRGAMRSRRGTAGRAVPPSGGRLTKGFDDYQKPCGSKSVSIRLQSPAWPWSSSLASLATAA